MNEDRNSTVYNTDSIYDNYLAPEGRQSQGASTLSGAGTDRFSGLAPPMPRTQRGSSNHNGGRQTAYSMADTASVYTTATTPFERWSLEDGLEPVEPKSPTSVYGAAGGTQRPPDSPRLAQLRNMGHTAANGAGGASRTAPLHAPTPVATSMSPQPVQYSRRHFSRPFRPDETEQQPNVLAMTTPKIMVGDHRFSASTPDAYGGASFSPAIQADSPRLSTYASDVAQENEMSHLRRRSNPTNTAFEDTDGQSMLSSDAGDIARAINHSQRNSLSQDSLNEKADEFNEKREPHPRPFSLSNTYPFTSTENGYGSHSADGAKTLNHKPSSRFSEDEKGVRSMDSTNEFHSSTWNLFGRSPVASPMWRHSEDGRRNLSSVPPPAENAAKQRKKRRIIIWAVAILILLALAGAGAGIGVWRHNVSVSEEATRSAKDGVSGSGNGSAASPAGTSTSHTGGTGNDSADVDIPARDTSAVAGSGGPGGYRNMVAFGGSYADNGHTRPDQYSSTLSVAPYDGGRATNGQIYQQYMSPLVGPTADESATIFNYAYSGSSINNTVASYEAPDLSTQIAAYLGDLNNGNATVAATTNNKALVTIWAGIEELSTVWENAIGSNPGDPQTPALASVQEMVNTLNNTLRWLIPATGTGIPDFVMITLPRGDLLPQTHRLANNNTGYVNVFRNMTTAYNAGVLDVAESLSRLTTVYTLDAEGLFDSIYTNPDTYNLTRVDVSCRDVYCTDAENYMWYDGYNPTTRMHSLVARHLAASILKPIS